MLSFLKVIGIFIKTLYYLFLSYLPKSDITELKQRWAYSILKSFGLDLTIKGQRPQAPNVVLVGNHIGFLDIVVLTAAEPRAVFLSKAEVANWPVIGTCAKRLGTLFVNRDSSDSRAAAKRALAERLKQYSSTYLAGFPSGTTTLNEDIPWKKGLIEIAFETSTPVQVFKTKYTPARACAYIDDDTLLLSMSLLFNTPNKSVLLEWGPCEMITDVIAQTKSFQTWAQPALSLNGEKTLNRSAHSLELQRR